MNMLLTTLHKYGLLSLFVLAFSATTQAHPTTWCTTANTNRNIPDNWSPGGVPTTASDLTIPNVTNKAIISIQYTTLLPSGRSINPF